MAIWKKKGDREGRGRDIEREMKKDVEENEKREMGRKRRELNLKREGW